jgi:hypothetical protein
MRKLILAVVVAAAISGGVTAPASAQVPVTDSAALAQMIQQLQALQQQIQQLQQLYATAQGQLQALTGARGMDAIAGNLGKLRNPLPDDYANNMVLPSALQAFGDIANGAASLIRQGQQITSYPGNDFYNQEVVRHGDRLSGEMAAAQSIYNTAAQRRQNLDLLRQQLAGTTDQASVAQLQARIAYETSQGINDLNQISAALLVQQSNTQMDPQRAQEAEAASRAQAKQGLLGK